MNSSHNRTRQNKDKDKDKDKERTYPPERRRKESTVAEVNVVTHLAG